MSAIQFSSNSATVAVIIPLYNKAKHISRAINSVLAQTYQNFEIIVVDDGSTDRSAAIVQEYDDPRIRLLHQANAGPGAARNRGIQESTTPLLAFLDADDEWMPNFLDILMRHLYQYPECALAAAGHYRTAEQVSWEPVFRQYGVTAGVWQMPPNIKTDHIKPSLDFIHSSAILVRRAAIARLGGFYDKHRCNYGEDLYLWLQIVLNYPIYRHPSPLVWYHTEASELGIGRKTVYPPQPILTDPELLWHNCPPKYHHLLNRCLTFYALLAASRCTAAGDSSTAQQLLRMYPAAPNFWWKYLKIQTNLFLLSRPQLKQKLRRVRDGVRAALRQISQQEMGNL